MKIDEPFNPSIKSHPTPENIICKIADESHLESITLLMAERNPHLKIEDLRKKTERELYLNIHDPEYRLLVAVIENEVVGLCRFYHSKNLPIEKKKFKSPEGWYAMGTLVSADHRRKNIAKFLSDERLKYLKIHNAPSLYSAVDTNNKTSIRMHEKFGYEEVERAQGFLHLDFQPSTAILYKLEIK